MAPLRLVKKENEQVTLDDLLELLGPEHLNAIDAKATIMRETFPCPYTVRDYDDFKKVLADYFAHYWKCFFNFDVPATITAINKDRHESWEQAANKFWKNLAFEFIEKHLGGQKALLTMERNAITGRERGMTAVIDNVTESIIKLHTHTYIQSVFLDNIAPSDYNTKLRIAQELLNKYGQFLFPGETLQPDYVLGLNLEEVITKFANHIHPIRRLMRE